LGYPPPGGWPSGLLVPDVRGTAAIPVSARVDGVVPQARQRRPVGRVPFQIAPMGASVHPAGKLDLVARQTDLPALTDPVPSSIPVLSPQSLLALVRHLKRRDLPSCQAPEKLSSC
jgi:hypothetical protein